MQLTLNCLSMLLLIKHRSMEVVKVLRTLKASFFPLDTFDITDMFLV